MNFFKSIGYNFTTYFFEKGQLLSFYKLENNEQDLFKLEKDNQVKNKSKIYTIDLVPPFFKLNLEQNFSFFSYNYFEGFACDLKQFLNAQDYLSKQQGSKTKKNLNRRIKKLEKCFPINYKIFNEDISQALYYDLMAALKAMIIIRFKQRNIVHGDIADWDFYTDTCYKMLKSKKACLYVIYNADEPIAISINYLSNTIFESAISSYNIDYAKFGLGNILVYKKIEWCFENGYTMLNMRWGDYPYKREWCNYVYKYESHVVFKKSSINSFVKAFFIFIKNRCVLFAIKNKSLIRQFMFFKAKEKIPARQIVNDYEIIKKHPENIEKNDVVDFKNEEFKFIHKAVIDFQYISNQTSESIKIYPQDSKIFLIEGLTKNQLIQYK